MCCECTWSEGTTCMLYKHIMEHTHTQTHKERCTERERLRERLREADKANLERAKYTVGNRGSKGWIKKEGWWSSSISQISCFLHKVDALFCTLLKKIKILYISDNCSFLRYGRERDDAVKMFENYLSCLHVCLLHMANNINLLVSCCCCCFFKNKIFIYL